MSNKSFYKIIASPRHHRNIFKKILHNPKKRQVIISILGIYTLVGSLVAFSMFSRTEQPVSAYEPALISANMQLSEDKEFAVGDTININLTLQNTSSEQAINDINLELLSTKDVIKWDKIEHIHSTTSKSYKIEKNRTTLDLLSSGERIDYNISGKLSDNTVPLSTVIGKINFTNQEGAQNVSTNKILVTAKESKAIVNSTLEVKTDKNVYRDTDKITLTLAPKGEFETSDIQNTTGKIYITNKTTKEVVRDDTCTIDESNSCVDEIGTLPVGKYSTLFINKDEKKMSLIGQFEVLGKSGEFQPDTNSTLEFPFGEKSINGIVPIYARKVVSLNNVVQANDACNFEVVREGKVVTNIKTQVNSDASCHTLLSASQLPVDAIYTIRLAGTNQQKDISIVKKSDKLLTLENKTLVVAKNKPVELAATKIESLTSPTSTPLTDTRATVGVLHQASGEYNEINNANGDAFKVINGNFNVTLPSQTFIKGGIYSIYFRTDDGQTSDFITISLDDREVGFTGTNVTVDNTDNLRVGKTMIFSVQGLTDRNSNPISGGECAADIYTSSNANLPILSKGEIKDGICRVTVTPDKVTKAGPILVSFTGDDVSNKINQSRQFTIKPGDTDSFGYLNLEYEPARAGYANNVIIGPLTDKKGNLTSATNKKLIIKKGDDIIKQFDTIDIENGFARVSIPGSTLIAGDVTLALYDNDEANTQLISKDIKVVENTAQLFLPSFPTTINSNEKIKVEYNNIPDANGDTECKLTFIRSDIDYFDGVAKYNTDKNKCTVEFDLDTLRNNSTALLRLQVGDSVFSSIVNLESSEPANLFTLTPQIELLKKDEVNVSLLSSPIVDKQGKVVTKGKVKVQYNGKIDELDIKDGLVRLDIDAKKLDTKDISTKLDQKFLELNINAKAGVTSISKTNNVSIFLGKKDIATNKTIITPKFAQTQVEANIPYIFGFNSDTCKVNFVTEDNKVIAAPTHLQGDICYVQVLKDIGAYTLSFEENGFVKYTFDVKVAAQTTKVNYSDNKPFNVELIGDTKGDEQVVVYDGENQYKFENKEDNTGIKVQQNGLNPIKDYLIEVKYQDANGNQVSHFKTVVGEKLVK
jgi:hypothetical protein